MSSDGVEYVEAPLTSTGNLRAWDSNGSRWVHFNFVIRVPSEINTHFVITFPPPEGEVPINVSLYCNGSSCLVSMHDDLSTQLRTTYRKIFPPNYALLIARSFDPIVIADNERCSIQVRLIPSD